MSRITSIFIILLINSVSASRSINTNGPQTPLVFKEEPSLYTLAQGPVFLHCIVVIDVNDKVFLEDHLTDSSDLYHDSYEEDDEYEEELFLSNEESSEEIRKRYIEQLNEQKIQYIENSDDGTYDSNVPFYGRIRRNTNYLGKVIHAWFRNGEQLLTTDPSDDINGFKIFSNGTLKINSTNQTAGSYRCMAKHSLYNIGAIISREVIVEEPDITKVITTPATVEASEGSSVVIICPISSLPAANITWHFNSSLIEHHGYKRDNRLFLLSNGSLLLTNARLSDSGKYRCNATNTFHRKRYRTAHILLTIQPEDKMERKLLPSLQNKIQMIPAGNTLVLYCAASDSSKISWTFKPRNGNISIQLLNFKEELKFVKVSVNKHDGTYVCSINDKRNKNFDYQSFDVSIMTTPSFYHKLESVTLPVAATIAFNCSASGNPKPSIQWFKNGKLIVNNFVRHSKDGVLRIESVEPEDEGIYQCFTGSVSMSNYLMVRKTTLLPSLKNVQCYPMDNNSILVTFDTVQGQSVDLVSYFLATNTSWIAPAPITIEKNEKYFIFWNNLKVLSPFGLYMRGFSEQSETFAMTRLSHGRDCSTQGLEPHFIKSPDGIFLWWSVDDESIHVTSFIIQLWYNGEQSHDQQNEAICSFYPWSSQYIMWSDVDSTLKNISIVTRSHPLESTTENVTITDLHLPGNATGILIPKTEQVKVRILSAVHDDGQLIDALQLTFLSWHLINATTPSTQMESKSIEVLFTDSRSMTISWNGFDKVLCLKVCYQQKVQFIDRGSLRNVICKQILKNSTMFTLRNLQPQTWYDVFLTTCSDSSPISKVSSISTLEDVPGPVADVSGRDNDGIRIYWKPPRNSNGVIDHYALEWKNPHDHQTQMMINVSCCKFQFPDTVNGDRFNVTIRAISVTGNIGNPHYLDLKKAMMNSSRRQITVSESFTDLWNEQHFVIILSVSIVVLAIIGTVILAVYLNRRQYLLVEELPKKSESKLVTHPANGAGNSKILLESQTLIQRTNVPVQQIAPNCSFNSFYHLYEEETSEAFPKKEVNDDAAYKHTIQNNWNSRRPLVGPNG